MDWFRRFGGTFVTDLDYGQVSWVYTHLFNVLFGIELFGSPVDSAEAYIGRHVAISVLSIIAVVGVAGITFQVTRSKAWALVAAAFLLSTPIWVGHSMFNPKDIPVAVGFTIYSFALVLLTRHVLFREQSPLVRVVSHCLFLLGVLLTVGTRTVLVAPMVLAALVALLIVWLARRRAPNAFETLTREFLLGSMISVAMFSILFIALFALNPIYYSQIFALLYDTFVKAVAQPWGGSVWMAGLDVEVPPPWWYIPVFLVFQLPIFLLAPFLFRTILLFARPLTRLTAGEESPSAAHRTALFERVTSAILLTQAVATPVAVALGEMVILDSIRHVLFIVPAIVTLAVLSYVKLVNSFLQAQALGVLFAMLLVVPVQISNLSLFPYNYVYFNELAALGDIDQEWETDFWHLSYREALERIPESVPVICGYWPEDLSEPDEVPAPCDELKPFVARDSWFATGSDAEVWLIMSQRYVVGGRERSELCEAKSEVSRFIHGQEILLSRIYSCKLP